MMYFAIIVSNRIVALIEMQAAVNLHIPCDYVVARLTNDQFRNFHVGDEITYEVRP